MTTTLLLVPHPDHASLLDGGPCGSRPPLTWRAKRVVTGVSSHDGGLLTEAHDGKWRPCPASDGTTSIGTQHALAIWHEDAPVLPGLWLLQAAILRVLYPLDEDVPREAQMGNGYTETEARDILALAESLGIGEGVTLEEP